MPVNDERSNPLVVTDAGAGAAAEDGAGAEDELAGAGAAAGAATVNETEPAGWPPTNHCSDQLPTVPELIEPVSTARPLESVEPNGAAGFDCPF